MQTVGERRCRHRLCERLGSSTTNRTIIWIVTRLLKMSSRFIRVSSRFRDKKKAATKANAQRRAH